MQSIAATAEDGVLVAANADNLSGGIIASQESLVINNDTFDNDDVVIIDQERILLGGSDSAGTYNSNTRAQESTTAILHVTSSNVLLKGGKVVLTKTFDGSTMLSRIRVGAMERDAVFALMIDGVIKYRVACSPWSELEKPFPFRPYTPAATTVIKVICWTFAPVNVSAVMES